MIRLSPFFLIYFSLLAIVLGAIFGSFICCAASRYAAGVHPFRGRSKCDACGHTLGLKDLVPVFSFLALKGRCRYCGSRIPKDCIFSELLLAGAFLLCLFKFDVTPEWVRALFLCGILLAISLIDFATFTIPDGLLLFAIGVWAVFLPFCGGLVQGLVGAFGISVPLLLLVLLLERLLKKEAMGGGDIKLLFVTGLFLGIGGNFLNLMLSCVIGVAFALFAGKKKDTAIPFGPSIAAGTLLTLLVGEPILAWYFRLF